jgi:hypothetical protein
MTWNKAGVKIKLDRPGPQFLCFLEWQRREYDAHPTGHPVNWVFIHCPLLWGLWTMRFLISHEENSLATHGFAEAFRKKWFPKELLWFYGIEAVDKDIES